MANRNGRIADRSMACTVIQANAGFDALELCDGLKEFVSLPIVAWRIRHGPEIDYAEPITTESCVAVNAIRYPDGRVVALDQIFANAAEWMNHVHNEQVGTRVL
jgi:hypothetical protein